MGSTTTATDIFPSLKYCTKLALDDTIHDVKFWPYGTSNDEQIFALTGETDTIVCRLVLGSDPPFEILQWLRDDHDKASFNSLAWTRDPETQKPWLCITGHCPKHIKIIDVETARVVRILSGHGRGVNDLAVSPLSTNILASCAEDSTIRLWDLDRKFEQQPCVALFGGEGHTAPILAICFHPNGRWLLSGGIDTAVCLWAVPNAFQLGKRSDSVSEPLVVYYPHFFTKELHPNYVDCFAFYGDLILSKAARDQGKSGGQPNEILLWRIEGFDSEEPPRRDPPIPVPGHQTRSSFPRIEDDGYRGFHRVLTFNIPVTDRFYHRFGFFHEVDMRPILCMGTQESKYLFWDFQRLEEGIDPRDRPLKRPRKKSGRQKNAIGLPSDLDLRRSASAAGSSTTGQTHDASTSTTTEEREFTLGDRFEPLEAHHKVIANTKLSPLKHFATSQIAWSPDGMSMVSVGDSGMICIFHREKKVVVSLGSNQMGMT